MKPTLQERVSELSHKTFLGGPAREFETMGRLQLITLLRCGLYPDSKVVDIGCGCLRGGYWLINFLQPGKYFGVEPNVQMLALGKNEILGPALLDEKRPHFLSNDQFDLSGFGEVFDFFIACSIWIHASKQQIQRMLDSFDSWGADNAVFLANYLPAKLGKDYTGHQWVGRSHQADTPGIVRHEFSWIQEECAKRDFSVTELPVDKIRHVWLLVAKGNGAAPMNGYLRDLIHGQLKAKRPREQQLLTRALAALRIR
jgi:SAM-dependent methyltransferase